MTTFRRDVRVQSPENPEDIHIHKASKQVAGGVPAVLSSMKHAVGEMGIRRSMTTLIHVNQKDGFDCPGCAWPDPEGHRSHAEFCENGAKAVAEEATTKRITAEFFQKYSVQELSEQSDFWLGKQGRLTQPMILKRESNYYEPISWEDAFQKIANSLNSLNSPNWNGNAASKTARRARRRGLRLLRRT